MYYNMNIIPNEKTPRKVEFYIQFVKLFNDVNIILQYRYNNIISYKLNLMCINIYYMLLNSNR